MYSRITEIVLVLILLLISEFLLPSFCLNEGKIATEKCNEYRNLNILKSNKPPERAGPIPKLNEEQTSGENEGLVQYILFGKNAKPMEYPHMAAIGYGSYKNITWACGGTLISEDYVMTAAHCVKSSHLGVVKFVQLGDIQLNGPTSKIFFVKSVHSPLSYNRKTFYNDIALLELNSIVYFSPQIFPACLTPDINPSLQVFALGWGRTENDSPSKILRTVDLEFFPNCSNRIRSSRLLPTGINETSQLCYGSKTTHKDTCGGDSGGPLNFFHTFDSVYYVYGITSFGKDCGIMNYPAVYTKVANFLDWIENIVWTK